jgi:DNA-binding FadR family transcriptional regulator
VSDLRPLSHGQRRVLRLIQQYRDATGEFPTVRFLARRLQVHHETVRESLAASHRKGWLATPSPAGLTVRIA